MKKYVTVVIPTYKRSDRIERAVASALNQSYNYVEIIVVDDNGFDTDENKKTKKRIEHFINNGKVIYLQNKENKGGAFSRNKGLEIATGEFITFLDDDDEIDSNKIEKQVERLQLLGNEYSAVYTKYKRLSSNGRIFKSCENIEGDTYYYALARSIDLGSGSNLLVRSEVAKKIGGYDVSFKRNQDLEFMVRMLENSKLAFVDEHLLVVHNEIRENNFSYDDLIDIDEFYLGKFKERIERLSKKQTRNIYKRVALERFSYSISKKKVGDGIINLVRNQVDPLLLSKFVLFLLRYYITGVSQSFKIK